MTRTAPLEISSELVNNFLSYPADVQRQRTNLGDKKKKQK